MNQLVDMEDSTFDKNEIDGIEAIDLYMSDVFEDEDFDYWTNRVSRFKCEDCKDKKQILRYTPEGLAYGYVCPKCQGTGLPTIVAPPIYYEAFDEFEEY
jgi:hypothetical protein